MPYTKARHHYFYKYLEALHLLEVVWKGYISAMELQEAVEEIADFMRENQIEYLLVDARESSAVKATDENWMRTYCMPMLASSGIRRMARVASPANINQSIESNIVNALNGEHIYGFNMQNFEERDNALDWLFSYETC